MCFILWILPLGFFIKPAQEKTACGGQRAVCMCSHDYAKADTKPINGFQFKAQSNSSKETAPFGGGAGNLYLAVNVFSQTAQPVLALNDQLFLAYRNPSLKSIEHIPKV